MKIVTFIWKLVVFQAVIFLFQACMDDNPPPVHYDVNLKDIHVLPTKPTAKDVVKITTYGCKYYALASITVKAKDITIKKRFNSQLKWPCVLTTDTISLGKLKKGSYKVTILVVDANPQVTDSIGFKETLQVDVLN
jgi:hypothetical protein